MTDGKAVGRGVEVAGQLAGASLGVLLGGPAGGIIGAAATPHLTDLVGAAWGELRGRRERNAVHVVAQAAEYVDTSADELLETALRDPDLSRLLHGALQTAAATLDEEKVEALARCLANGVDDVARVDEEALVVRALADLEPAHVRVLAKLQRSSMGKDGVHRFLSGDIDARTFLTAADLSGPVLSLLERHGLVEPHEQVKGGRGGKYDRGPEVEIRYACTEFGQICLQRLGHGEGPARFRLFGQGD